jgi:hypothetical protein
MTRGGVIHEAIISFSGGRSNGRGNHETSQEIRILSSALRATRTRTAFQRRHMATADKNSSTLFGNVTMVNSADYEQ